MSSCEKRFFINVSYYVVCETDSYRCFCFVFVACLLVCFCLCLCFQWEMRRVGWGRGGREGGFTMSCFFGRLNTTRSTDDVKLHQMQKVE